MLEISFQKEDRGYSEYDPVARNVGEAGKQKNRRIEIILEPRLKAIPGLQQLAKK